jgi:hypothetical protein
MWQEFRGIIKSLKLSHPEAVALQQAIVACTGYQKAESLLGRVKPEEQAPGDSREYRTTYSLCKACVDYESHLKHGLENALEEALDAVRGFRSSGDLLGEGLACRVVATIYQKQGKASMAIAELNRAIEVFTPCLDLFETESDINSKWICQCQISECKEVIKKIELTFASPGTDSSEQAGQSKRPFRPTASIIFGVHDFAHASRVGKYVMDDDLIEEIAIDELSIDGITHKIYPAQKGNSLITLTSGKEYRWLRVAGNSMNQAEPTIIEPGDYVLADLSRMENIGDIVVAGLNNPPTPAERAGVVKRHGGNALKSESDEQVDPIPISEVKIRGVVLAVAKPSSSDPKNPL